MRRGQHAMYVVMGMVLLVLVLVVSLSVFFALRDVYSKTEDESRCAFEIRAHATAVKVSNELKAPDIVCPTERRELTLQDDVNHELAYEMKRCWDMWGRGQLQLFGEAEGLYCHVCMMLRVPEDVRGLPEYLDTTDVPGLLNTPTYAQYLAGAVDGFFFLGEDAPDLSEVTIPSDKPIGVIFYYAKGQDWFGKLQNHLMKDPARNTALGATSGAVIGVVAAITFSSGPVGWAVLIVGGAATGAGAGFFNSFTMSEDLDYMSAIIVRSLSEADVANLGCTYAPAANT